MLDQPVFLLQEGSGIFSIRQAVYAVCLGLSKALWCSDAWHSRKQIRDAWSRQNFSEWVGSSLEILTQEVVT